MDDEKEKMMMKLLVAMAWADGRVDAEEMQVVEAMLESYGVEPETTEEVLAWAKTPRTLDDVDIAGLSSDDAELVLHQSVLLSFVDGEQSDKEIDLLNALIRKLAISTEAADAVMKSATAHAQSLLPVLQA
jgi:uncharacterized membrane protein YebE (DUF533 family)